MEGLTQITINGSVYPLFFGMHAVETFTKQVGELEENTTLGTTEMAYLVYAGLKNAAIRKKEILPILFEDVYDAVEEKYYSKEGQAEILEISKVFAESKAVKYLAEQAAEEGKKKKLTGKK